MVEGNDAHHLSVVPYLGKVLIWVYLGYLIGIKHLLGVFNRDLSIFQYLCI